MKTAAEHTEAKAQPRIHLPALGSSPSSWAGSAPPRESLSAPPIDPLTCAAVVTAVCGRISPLVIGREPVAVPVPRDALPTAAPVRAFE